MNFCPNRIYHIYNQGNNRQTIFHNRKDYLIFLTLYRRLFKKVCSTIAWCLMPNHFHFMIYTDERCENQLKQGGIFIDPITNCIRKLLSGYARIYNNQYRQSGFVFRQKTKSKCLTEIKIDPDARETIHDYYINCFHYIHQNPFTAGLVQRLEDWEFSSFRDYAALRSGDLCRKELAIAHCGYKAETFIDFSYELVQEKMKNHFYEERISGRLNKGPG